jgi:hypothetical protein
MSAELRCAGRAGGCEGAATITSSRPMWTRGAASGSGVGLGRSGRRGSMARALGEISTRGAGTSELLRAAGVARGAVGGIASSSVGAGVAARVACGDAGSVRPGGAPVSICAIGSPRAGPPKSSVACAAGR